MVSMGLNYLLLWQEFVTEWNLWQEYWIFPFQDYVNDLRDNLCCWFSLHVTSGHCSHIICICTCHPHIIWAYAYVLLRLCVQNRRTKWNFLLNFRTMHKLSELYSGIFQTQSSGWVSGLDHFRNFPNLKILNIQIVKYLLNCKRYLSYTFRIVHKSSECWVLENLDVHLERTTSELELKSEKSKIGTFCLEFNGQVLVRQD